MVFKKICPRCKRRYPQNFTTCLECGSLLIDTAKVEQREKLQKYLPILGKILLCAAIIAVLFLFALPVVQHTFASGSVFGNLNRTAESSIPVNYAINQPASDGSLKVVIVKTREGSVSTNTKKFFLVTVTLQNLRNDKPIRVSGSDFTLFDGADQPYPSYGLGDKITREIGPLRSETYDLTYEIPQNTANMRIGYTFPRSGDRSGQTVFFFL
jgi:hypothetical protein